MRLVTVATFSSEPEAQLARTTLAAHGIEGTLVDDNIVALDPFATLAYRGVKVQVPDVHVDEAQDVLASHDAPTEGDAPADARESIDVARPPSTLFGATTLVLALVGIFLIVGEPQAAAGWFLGLAAIGTWIVGRLPPPRAS